MKYTTLLIDADDTLFDFDKAEETSLDRFYKRMDLKCPYNEFREVYNRENHLLWKAFERGKATAEKVKVQRFVNTMKALELYEDNGVELSRIYMEELSRCRFLLPGADDFCEKLSSHYNLYVITNGLWDVQRSRVGDSEIYRRFFKGLIVSEKVGSAKPDKGIFDEARKTAGNPLLEEMLIIGDSLTSDIRGGDLYGIDSCWFNPGGKELVGPSTPTYEVADYESLLKILL
ncbi:YjjG family noncanonical pyrimidine nucleotidase [Spirochaeta isovalerica]|uniref:2-haloacid dehalogenase n=1 Tax=Spirochaeta isovalerica TaxID=150 RepID=A0A841R3J3_9SPIO|nr:YjjG family noncanonical pyrimidine nucleotidase [Spirochaeta isovalerica]MBB6478445.1 2-haloacid dehalogenase [Spirochaeta isovalerica]